MKYFTLRWWAGKVENPMAVNEQYCRYVQSVKKSLPKDLWRLFWNVSLHDAPLRRLHFAQHKLELKLDGERRDKGKYRLGLQRFRLTYDGVSRMTSLASPREVWADRVAVVIWATTRLKLLATVYSSIASYSHLGLSCRCVSLTSHLV